jgi:hypothetical protein
MHRRKITRRKATDHLPVTMGRRLGISGRM